MDRWSPINLDSLLHIEKIVIEPKAPVKTEPAEEPIAITPVAVPSDEIISANISLELTLIDARTLDTLEAQVVLINQNDQTVIASERINNKYAITFTNNDRAKYRIKIAKDGYLPYESMIHVFGVEKRNHSIKETVALNPMENTFTGIMNVFFGHDSAIPNSFEDLQYLEFLMKDNKGIKVEISGYTDNTGEPEYNKSLSQRRADAVKDYLVEHGIDAFRIKSVGHGMDQPIGDNKTRIGRRLNRRTEFKILL